MTPQGFRDWGLGVRVEVFCDRRVYMLQRLKLALHCIEQLHCITYRSDALHYMFQRLKLALHCIVGHLFLLLQFCPDLQRERERASERARESARQRARESVRESERERDAQTLTQTQKQKQTRTDVAERNRHAQTLQKVGDQDRRCVCRHTHRASVRAIASM